MLGRIRIGSGFITRSFSTRGALLQKGFVSPNEYVEQVKQEKIEQEQFKQELLSNQIPYAPKTLSSTVIQSEGRPVPLNVELLKYKPLTLPQTHGDQVAVINFRSYEEADIIRAGEFAMRAAYYLGIPTSHLKSLKTEKRLYTVIKAPFVFAKSKQNFHRITFQKRIVAYDANPDVVDLWLSYLNRHKLDTVDYKVELTARESLNYVEDLKQLKDLELPKAYEGIEDPIAVKVQELLKSDDFKKLI
ncbi:30S ribosomal protein S10, mitochondrial precursor [Spathaspora passalidarum NRRL Y-27907]|uniref:30S ribosomal protein S10, mitochondrial n=1 Tax=Spathaspora passalidarum (strain NRRL Y-27907 / 11-Y1) TaxID=619300 RepID=G3ARZ8_SPAPN|nr:30S ribosomal protein S10, mitochondrial precursor [Spathaspora passalidarum NRRL Y-27907]EGW31848.1 30S ribosomal protein S10, mitochondrial precursor [Spathaspora passalidarum NRRL Y-27907]